MSAPGSQPSRIVTVHGESLDLFIPRQADRFLALMTSYGAAARCEWEKEYLLAQRIVSMAIHDATQSDEDAFEALADALADIDQGDH